MTSIAASGIAASTRLAAAVACVLVATGTVAIVVAPVGTALAVVGALLLVCAVVDERSGRIPNRLVLLALVAIVGACFGSLWAASTTREFGADVLAGALIGGGPLLFVVWLIRPRAIGGGDWKLLTVVGGSLGLVSPLLAGAATLVACGVQLGRSMVERRRSSAFAPAVAVGFGTALCLAPWLERFGGLTP